MPEYSEPGPPDRSRPPSGRQFEVVNGSAAVVVAEVGGGLRTFDISGEPVLFGYPAEELCSGGKGQVLAPWPNRLEDGTYSFGGVSASASLDEPAHANAIHGLVRWMNWAAVAQSDRSVTMAVELPPQPGYPWRVSVEVTYELMSETTLRVSAAATNAGRAEAPFGIGFHPYVHAGEGGVDGCRLRFAAAERLVADDRGLPVGALDVARTEYDFARGRSLSGRGLDDCFFGFAGQVAPEGSSWSVAVERADGRTVTVSAGPEFPYVMCFTGDTLGEEDRRRAIAVEPMSCPPNALRSGTSLIVLGPAGGDRATWRGSWHIAASGW